MSTGVVQETELPGNLPSPHARWTSKRKLQVMEAVRSGQVPLESVLERYAMSEQEFRIWQQSVDKFGVHGLKVTKFRWRSKTE